MHTLLAEMANVANSTHNVEHIRNNQKNTQVNPGHLLNPEITRIEIERNPAQEKKKRPHQRGKVIERFIVHAIICQH